MFCVAGLQICIHTYIVHTCMHAYIYVCIYIYTHTHTYIRIYIQPGVLTDGSSVFLVQDVLRGGAAKLQDLQKNDILHAIDSISLANRTLNEVYVSIYVYAYMYMYPCMCVMYVELQENDVFRAIDSISLANRTFNEVYVSIYVYMYVCIHTYTYVSVLCM
jgi:hypothetical protein